MQLNEKRLKILQQIKNNCNNSAKIAQSINLTKSTVVYHLEELCKEGYILFGQNHSGIDGCHLKDKGIAAIENPEDFMIQPNSTIPMTNNISISNPSNSPISILQDADNNNVTINQNIDQNVAEIIKSLEQLKQTIQTLPTDEKEDAEDFLGYIQEEIEKPSEQRDESKIAKNFKRFCKLAVPFLLSGIITSADFTNNITDLASKFNVDLPKLSMIK